MQHRINQIRLLVNDFSACFRFYRDVIGLPVGSGSEDDPTYASFALGSDLSLGLFGRGEMAAVVGAGSKPAHGDGQDAILLVFEVDNLDQAVDALKAKGVTFAAPPTDRPDWGMRTAHFRDPDGNLLEIFHPLKAE